MAQTQTQKPQLPAVEGWFTEGDAPALIGTRCKQCSTYYFPKQSLFCRNPGCQSRDFEEVPLSRRGRIWSYVENHYEPPAPYIADGEFKPYMIAAVELEQEKMVVLGQVASGVAHSDLKAGLEVELVVERLYEDEDGERTIWKWRPVGQG